MSDRILLLGATGLVGGEALTLLLAHPGVTQVIAPTRRTLAPHARLANPVGDIADDSDWGEIDAVICALGTTRAIAGSAAAFRTIDRDLPLAVAAKARAHGARRFVLNSALGANARSRLLYPRTKGELEDGIVALGFQSLTIVRPGLIGGHRAHPRNGERAATAILSVLGFIVPRRYRINPADRIAGAMIAAALDAAPGRHVISSEALI